MQSINLEQCFKGAWRDGLGLLRSRPILCGSVFVVLFVSTCLRLMVQTAAQSAALIGAQAGFDLIALGLLALLVQLFGYAVLCVQAVRHTLVGPEANRQMKIFGDGFWRYVWLYFQVMFAAFVSLLLLTIAVGLLGRVIGKDGALAVMILLGLVLFCGVSYLAIRVALLFSQVAVGKPKRWKDAWADSRGHFWSMFATYLLIALSLTVTAIVIGGGVVLIMWLVTGGQAPDGFQLVLALVQALLLIVILPVMMAGYAWVYKRFADRLLGEGGDPAAHNTPSYPELTH